MTRLLLMLALMLLPLDGVQADGPGVIEPGAALHLQPCADTRHDVPLRCGTLPVPESRARADGRKINLKILVIPASHPRPALAPLYDLAGGPGFAARDGVEFYLTAGAVHRQDRDVILVDQRGTGGSAALECPELAGTGSDFPAEAVRECRMRLAAKADLASYTTAESVADLQAVRAALGHGAVDVVGLSYGTRLALAWIDADPQAVRSAVLIGAVPDDARPPLWHARHGQDVLDAVLADCGSDAACATAFPRLARDWAQLQAHPGFDGAAREALRNRLATTTGQRALPALVSRLAEEGPRSLATPSPSPSPAFADGLFLSITCAEDVPWIGGDLDAAVRDTFLGDWRIARQRAACGHWNVPARRLSYARSPSSVPVLFLAGERDHVTPPEWAERIAAQFPHGRVVRIPGLGHFPEGLQGMECIDAMIAAVGRDADLTALSTTCVAGMAAPPFTPSTDTTPR